VTKTLSRRMHLQRAAHDVAVLVRCGGLRATTRAALPNPRQRAGIYVGGRAAQLI
jgi:hypothetical protein